MKKLDALSLLSTYMLGNIAKNVHFPNLEGSCVKKRRKNVRFLHLKPPPLCEATPQKIPLS
ncbi:MAG: hypothetical protein LKH78_14575 [Weizmannia coagulans]|jgi:hypothetical protein|uniref:hypothetical protein n=1 Tax=Heyndrickxia TaxID=2837504 RepID=UPI0005532920|nr:MULTISPECIES: hypothetical protein [Heyndrickxia]NWN94660.1 hypothetical protein [Bacillus sp. (in: firmicutes)]KGT37479.1 hypothetical protein P421_15025 [Heyndrickxia coagulans P38]MCI1576899.1 hypothetical protein [Heyndrickxia coagulans]MDT9754684.1 hypothetical protein [Heyndrickxia coagulans]MEC5268038.1 hypothetical protein [Heyndrickxia coagulans]